MKERLCAGRMLLLATTLALGVLFNLPEGVAAEVPSNEEETGTVLMKIAQSLGFFIGDQLTSRSDSVGGCNIGGRYYSDQSWVPVGGSRLCRCLRGIVRAPCRTERRRIPSTPPSSFAVGLSFGTSSSRGGGNRSQTIDQIKEGVSEVSFKTPVIRLEDGRTKVIAKKTETKRKLNTSKGTQATLASDKGTETTLTSGKGTQRRLTSGRGTAKLFRLFPEVVEPVLRTSNKTGCHVGGDFYQYPALTQSMSACRCTVEGMLWCWNSGIPTCLGCMVAQQFVPAEETFRISDGSTCSCSCKTKMEERCLRENVLLYNNAVVR